MIVVIDSAIPFIRGVFEPYAEVRYAEGGKIDAAMVRDCDAMVVRTRTRCDARLLDSSRIKAIATATIGLDHIDEAYCREFGIAVYSASGCNARGVLQWVAAALRHICHVEGRHPASYTLGVVGVGNVGSLVVEHARHWGFNVLKCDPPRFEREGGDYLPIDEVARRSDILTLHTPLDSTTRHLVDGALLSTMPREAIILNASRGAVVDNRATLHSGHRYIFDVWEEEPAIPHAILHGAMLATPHIAGYSLQGKANATAMAVRALATHFGLPLCDWYPEGIATTTPRLISWEELCHTLDDYFQIEVESQHLKRHPEQFEQLRNNYNYRKEYF